MKASKPEDVGESRQLVTNEPVEFENNWMKLETTAGKLPIVLEEFIEYYTLI